MYKELFDKLKNIKLSRNTILTIIGSIVAIFTFMILGQKGSCMIGTYKYTGLDGKEGYANNCSYDKGVPVCEIGKSVVVVSNYHKNKWCN